MTTQSPAHVASAPTYIFLGTPMKVLLSGAQTGGAFSLIEASMPPGGDGGLHVHTREDEALYLLDGELHVTVGEESFVLKAGESYFGPRNVPHRLQNRGSVSCPRIPSQYSGNLRSICEAGRSAAGGCCGNKRSANPGADTAHFAIG